MDSNIKKSEAAYSELQSAEDSYASTQKLSNTIGLMNSDQATAIHSTSRSDKVMRSAEMDFLDWDDRKQGFFTHTLKEFEGGVNGTNMDERSAFLAAYMATNQYWGDQQQTLDTLSKFEGNQVSTTQELEGSALAPKDNTHVPVDPTTRQAEIPKPKGFETIGSLEPQAPTDIDNGKTLPEGKQGTLLNKENNPDMDTVKGITDSGNLEVNTAETGFYDGKTDDKGKLISTGFNQQKLEQEKEAHQKLDDSNRNKNNAVTNTLDFVKSVEEEGVQIISDSKDSLTKATNFFNKDD